MSRLLHVLGIPFPSRSASTAPIDTSGSFFNPEFWLNDMFADDYWGM